MDPQTLRRRQTVNKASARFIPALLTAIVVYASYVVVGRLCIGYLLNHAGRTAAWIVILVVHFVLLIPMAFSYLRLLLVVFGNPGYTTQTQAYSSFPSPSAETTTVCMSYAPPTTPVKPSRSSSSNEPRQAHLADMLDYMGIMQGRVQPPQGLEEYYTKETFVCDGNGLPLWCNVCRNWKPDRSHHCSDVGRCVKKMDHFCPWIGGVVGERSFKFFVQFNFYACLYTLFVLIVMAFFLPDRRYDGDNFEVQWIVVLALAGLFFLFTLGMTVMNIQMIFKNVTTIESIDVAERSMYLAVLIPPAMRGHPIQTRELAEHSHTTSPEDPAGSQRPLTSISTRSSRRIAPPLPAPTDSSGSMAAEAQQPTLPGPRELGRIMMHGYRNTRQRLPEPDRDLVPPPESPWKDTVTYPLYLPPDRPPLPAPPFRTFAILRTPPGMNPWDLGPYENLRQIMGRNLAEWIFPLKHSPCSNYDGDDSFYPLGQTVQQLKRHVGITRPASSTGSSKRKRKRKLSRGWMNGERPDAWILEKEAKRRKREQERRAARKTSRGML